MIGEDAMHTHGEKFPCSRRVVDRVAIQPDSGRDERSRYLGRQAATCAVQIATRVSHEPRFPVVRHGADQQCACGVGPASPGGVERLGREAGKNEGEIFRPLRGQCCADRGRRAPFQSGHRLDLQIQAKLAFTTEFDDGRESRQRLSLPRGVAVGSAQTIERRGIVIAQSTGAVRAAIEGRVMVNERHVVAAYGDIDLDAARALISCQSDRAERVLGRVCRGASMRDDGSQQQRATGWQG